VIEGNRKYVRCLYVYNKIDTLSIEEVDALARKPDSIVISIYMNLNLDFLLQKMWDYLGLTRIYTKRRGIAPDLTVPVVIRLPIILCVLPCLCLRCSVDLAFSTMVVHQLTIIAVPVVRWLHVKSPYH
jgi:hypothetical protein